MPTLSIDIEARFAKFQDGLDKIDRDVSRATRSMSKSFSSLKGVAASFIGTFAGIAAVGGIKSVINDLEKLNTVSERTGIAAKELSGLAFAAGQTGTDLEVMAKSINKLNIALSNLASGNNKELKGILTSLGLPEFAKGAIDAQEALLQLAEVFPRLSEADQSALALAAFGKAGQEMIPALKGGRKELEALINSGKELFPVTNDLAKSADDFNDAMSKVGLVLKSTLIPLLDVLLPKLLAFSNELINARKAGLSFFDSLNGIGLSNPFKTSGEQIKALTAEIDKAEAAGNRARTTFGGIVIPPANIEKLKKLREYFKLQQQDEALLLGKGIQSNEGRVSLPGALKLPQANTKTPKGRVDRDDSAQRLLDQQIKAFEQSIDKERELAQTRNDFLQRFYDDGLISLGDYTKARIAIMDESANAQKVALGSEIALLEASKKGKKADDRIAIDTKINDLLEKQATLNQDVKIAGANLYLDNIKAGKEYADVLERINIRALESKGDIVGAAKRQFSLENRDDLTKIDTQIKSGATPEDRAAAQLAKDQIKAMGERNTKMAEFDVLSAKVRDTRNDAADAEERINIAVETGQISQIDGLQQISAIRTKLSADLLRQGELLENIALLTKDPAQIESMKALGIEIERLNAQLDPLRDKVEGVFSDSFSRLFDKLASGTASAKDAVKELFKEILGGLAKMGKDSFLKQVFGKEGSLGGVVDTFSGNQSQGGGIAAFFGLASTQKAAPISEGIASSGAGAVAALALKDVATSSTATSYALKEFADGGVANATEQLFQNVSAGVIEQTANQNATGSLAALAIATDLATEAMIKQAASAAVSGAVQSSAGGFAEGGQVTGAGSGTSDSIPALLSNREFVIRAQPVQQKGALEFLKKFNKMGMKALPRYSMGGLVGRMGLASNGMAIAGGGMTLVQNFTIPASTPRETQQQLASSAYSGGVRAYRRNR